MAESHVITADNMQIDDAVLLGITSGLPFTDKQRKLLAVVCLPQTSCMKVLDQCKIAGITQQYYYERINNSAFQEAMAKFSRSVYKSETPKFAVKYRNIALNGDRQALERLNEQNGVLDKKESIIEVNVNDSRRDIKGKTLHGLGAFDAEWEDVSDENVPASDNGDDSTKQEALECDVERAGHPENETDGVELLDETSANQPDSHPDQSNQGTVSDDNEGNDTASDRAAGVLDDTIPGIVGQTSVDPPDSHTTGQDGSAHDSPVR